MKWLTQIQGKKVVFLTTKNLDYLRNVQEIELLYSQAAEVKVIGSTSKNYIKRMITVYSQYMRAAIKEYDIVFCGFAPQLVYPLLRCKKPKFLIMDFFISCYDTLVFDRKKFSEKSIVAKWIKALDANTLKLADVVIGDTKSHCSYFSREFQQPEELFQVLYLQADTDIYYPREVSELILAEKRILYFGSILPLQGIEVVLEATKLLPERQFVIIGPVKKENVEGMSNVTFIPWLSQEELAQAISEASLCLAGHFHKDIMKAKRTIPGKAYIYSAMRKPMILGDNEATRELYCEEQSGIYFVEMGSPQALADKIKEILK